LENINDKLTQSMSSIERFRLEIAKIENDIHTLSREYQICLEKKKTTSQLLNQIMTKAEPKVMEMEMELFYK
jgi:hypothetical protein